jgi:hypothetical protein
MKLLLAIFLTLSFSLVSAGDPPKSRSLEEIYKDVQQRSFTPRPVPELRSVPEVSAAPLVEHREQSRTLDEVQEITRLREMIVRLQRFNDTVAEENRRLQERILQEDTSCRNHVESLVGEYQTKVYVAKIARLVQSVKDLDEIISQENSQAVLALRNEYLLQLGSYGITEEVLDELSQTPATDSDIQRTLEGYGIID